MSTRLRRLRERIGAVPMTCRELVVASERAGLRARFGQVFEVRPTDLVTLGRDGGIHVVGAPAGSVPCGRVESRSREPLARASGRLPHGR